MKSFKLLPRMLAGFGLLMMFNMSGSAAEVAFSTPFYKVNLNGDMTTLGNTIIWKDTASADQYGVDVNTSLPTDRNNAYTMKFVDVLSDGAVTFNSSSSSLNLPAGYTVKWAGLYWQGHIVNTGLESGANNSNIGTGNNANAIYNDAKSKANSVYFKLPSGLDYNLTAQVYYDYPTDLQGQTDQRYLYSGFYDVTNYVKAAGNGSYTVGNLRTSEGQINTWGGLGGWAMLVVYEDPSGTLQLKNISLFHGYRVLNSGQSQDINVSGFYTPPAGTINASLAVFVADGDKLGSNNTGEHLKMWNTSNVLTDINNSANPLLNVFNSSITNFGVDNVTRTPYFSDNLGIDIDRFNVSSYMSYGQSSTKIQVSTEGDLFTLDLIAFATDVYQPQICYVENIFNGTTNISGIGAQVNKDDNLTVRVYVKNTGNEVANNVQVSHQFDTSFPYVINSANYNNSNPAYQIVMPPSYTRTNASDSSGNDLFEYNSGSLLEKINLGVDANSSSGGTFNPSSGGTPTYAVFEYNATVKVLDSNYTNVYQVGYVNSVLGIDYTNNPITMKSCDGSQNSFYGIGAANIDAIGFDVREPSILLADNNRSITTKIVNKPISLNVVPLNASGAIAPYNGIDNNRVYLFTVDTSVCSLSESDRLAAIATKPRTTYVTFTKPDTNHVAPDFTETSAGKDKKIMMNFINWNQEFLDAAFNCSNSNTQAVLNGVPQCLNSDSKLAQVFPSLITECLLTGAKPACQSSSYAASGTGVPTPPYDNPFGCYQCLAGGAGAAVCSTDNFAIRPDRFKFTVAGLMKAGEDYNITTYAKNYSSTANTTDYNQTVSNLTGAPKSWWNRDTNAQIATVNTQGTTTIAGAWDFANGTGSVPIRFSDVGKFTLDLNDTNWAAVDTDTALADRTIHGEGNVTFIPWDFNISTATITNNKGTSSSFTYLSNDLNMSARIPMTVFAQNKQGGVTQNYANNMYDRNITITPYVSSVAATARGLTPLTSGAANADGNFTTGSTSIAFNDALVGRFNFSRDPKVAVFPFDVNSSNGIGSDVNVSIVDTDSVRGDRNQTLDGNATFVYGRVIPRDIRVFGSVPYSANAWYEVFNAPSIGGTTLPTSRNEAMWYTNTLHTDFTDGNGTVSQVPGGNLPNNTTYSAGVKTYNFNASTTIPFGAKAHIDTDPWLWYGETVSPYLDPSVVNLNCMTHPCFNINVVPAVGATGSAITGSEANKGSKKSTNSAGAGGWKSTSDYAPAVR